MKVYLKNVTSSGPPKIVNNGECTLERNVVRFHTDKYLDGKKNFNDGRPGFGSFEYTAKFGEYGNGFNAQITVIGDNNVLGNVYYCNVTYGQKLKIKWWLNNSWLQNNYRWFIPFVIGTIIALLTYLSRLKP